MLAVDATSLLFVGECRSLTAKRKNWTWKDGRLAAVPLFEALRAMGVDPAAHRYINLWSDNAEPLIPWQRVASIRREAESGAIVVALGKRASSELSRRAIEHVALVHPAARGKIRKRATYIAHVKERLTPSLARSKIKHTARTVTNGQIQDLIDAKVVPLAVALDAMGMRANGLPTKHEQRHALRLCAKALNARTK